MARAVRLSARAMVREEDREPSYNRVVESRANWRPPYLELARGCGAFRGALGVSVAGGAVGPAQ